MHMCNLLYTHNKRLAEYLSRACLRHPVNTPHPSDTLLSHTHSHRHTAPCDLNALRGPIYIYVLRALEMVRRGYVNKSKKKPVNLFLNLHFAECSHKYTRHNHHIRHQATMLRGAEQRVDHM